jgi:multimeric flavodoxin WrbA
MKIIAISGSPRRGNTISALNTIKDNNPGIDFRIITLSEMNFGMCKGCYVCVLQGEAKCPIKDDRDEILQAIMEADGLILASPVYAHMISALMKNFIDRLGYLAHRPCFFDKFAMALTTYSGYGTEEATKYMEKILSVYGFSLAPPLELMCRPGKKSERTELVNQKKSLEVFAKLAARIEKGEKDKPSLNMLVPFGIFKYVSEIGRNEMKADYEYYRNKTDYYYETKVPQYKKIIARRVIKKITAGFTG